MCLEFYTYASGFMALGVCWILHNCMFHFIKRSDGGLVWLNIAFLALAVLVPFRTKVLDINSGSKLAISLYGTCIVVTNLVLLGIWQYATRGHRLVDGDIDEPSVPVFNKVIMIGTSIMAPGAAGSCFTA